MSQPDHARYMTEAVELALAGVQQGHGGPFGCVIVRDGAVIGRGSNRVLVSRDPTAHAEVVAIRDACARSADFSLAGATLYTSCEPCPMCLAAIYWARIERVYFAAGREDAARAGFDDEFLYAEFARPPSERKIELVPLARDEGRRAFEAWMKKSDRVAY